MTRTSSTRSASSGAPRGSIDRLGPGDVLGLRGPFGKGWPLQEARYKDVLVITGGIGCAPVTGAIDYMFRRRASYGHLTILHGVKKPVDLVHRSRFAAWRREPDTTVLLTADQRDRAWRDRSGVVTDLFEEIAVDAGRTIGFMCGPEVMILAAPSWFVIPHPPTSFLPARARRVS